MAEYVTQAEVKKRATVNGWKYIADRDRDGVVNATESAEVDAAIAWAGDEIDSAIAPKVEPEDARGQQVRYLKNICIDLAVYRLFTNGGDDATASVQAAFDAANERLARLRSGESVPGLKYVYPQPAQRTTKVPRATGGHR